VYDKDMLLSQNFIVWQIYTKCERVFRSPFKPRTCILYLVYSAALINLL